MIVRARMTVGCPLVLDRRLVGGVDLHRIVAAEPQLLQLLVGQVLDHVEQPRIDAEEVLADVGAGSTAYFWYWPSTTSPMRLTSRPSLIARPAADPSRCPRCTLMTFQPAPRKIASSSWMILPLPRTGPSSRCRLQLMTKIRLSSFSRDGEADRAERFRLVGLAVAEERPDLRGRRLLQAAILQVAVEARLVDRHDRAEAHRHRRELPELRHQPRVRIRRQPAAGLRARGGSSAAAPPTAGLRGTRARRCRARRGPGSR